MSQDEQRALLPIERFSIDICAQCLALEGECCNNPQCLFCWKSTAEIAEYLNVLLIRPVIDDVRMAAIIPEESEYQRGYEAGLERVARLIEPESKNSAYAWELWTAIRALPKKG